jgi:radical SAM-linked protein
MIGLPTETDEDLDGIIRLANDLLARGKRVSKRHVQLNISVSTFVPKPHTPFQWMGQISIDEVRRKQAYLAQGLRKKGIALKPHDPETSLLEGAFARGDRNIGRVIEEAMRLGCRFDGWTECFDFAKWNQAFLQCGLDMPRYACRTFGLDDVLPWDRIKSGVTGEFLKREYQRAAASEITENCREACSACGLGCADGGTLALGRTAAAGPASGEKPSQSSRGPSEMTTRIRMKFSKTGRIRFLSHLDFMTMVHRAAVRAGVPIAFSQGFNPHPKIAFGPALSVGMESDAEFLDMETDPFVDLLRTTKKLNSALPAGVRILEARIIPKKAPSLSGHISRYRYEIGIPEQERTGLEARVKLFLSRATVLVDKEGTQKDIRPGIEAISIPAEGNSGKLSIVLVDQDRLKPRVQDVIEHLFSIGREQTALFRVTRVEMSCREQDRWISPMDV